MSALDSPDSTSLEDTLTPPKYDGLGVAMATLSALIISVVSGVIILLVAYLSIGNFSLESGVSPILLAMITFFGLTIGNILYYILLSKVFSDIYTRGRTALAQVAIMSILLYIFFVPVYIGAPMMSYDPSVILVAFALHVLINTLSLHLVIGLTANYRYALLILYSNIMSFLVTGMIMAYVFLTFSQSSTALFLLMGLVIVAQTLGSLFSSIASWIYYIIYTTTGYDPIGSVYARIEQEEKSLEQEAEKLLTQFPQK